MEIKGKVHCFFEQSGTFKNEFKKLGYDAELNELVGKTITRIEGMEKGSEVILFTTSEGYIEDFNIDEVYKWVEGQLENK
jgi:hypothetical protein